MSNIAQQNEIRDHQAVANGNKNKATEMLELFAEELPIQHDLRAPQTIGTVSSYPSTISTVSSVSSGD